MHPCICLYVYMHVSLCAYVHVCICLCAMLMPACLCVYLFLFTCMCVYGGGRAGAVHSISCREASPMVRPAFVSRLRCEMDS